ncbi:MAG: SCO family protein [Halomonadaceae bacterium]|uniref:SCO family protein n=1 Tax=Halomonas colorata TaxID=2742615 RepID=A0ABR9G0Y4_9GAMM|nr:MULTISPECIES: SCO family protein [Halomonas]MBE0464568.1 SCO family protein [Halomonas colorata]
MYKVLLATLTTLLLVGCSDQSWRTTDVADIMPPLDFALVDENGDSVQAEEYLGKPTLVYFGYTYCPDVCPITLARLGDAIRKLDDETRDEIQVLFISVDPARDTPEVLKRYTDAFGPEFVGLSGDKAAIDAVTNRYRVAYEYGEENENGDYLVTHSSAVFAFDREGQAQFLVRDSHPVNDVEADIKRLVAQG